MSNEEQGVNINYSEIFPTHGNHGKVKHQKGLVLGNAIPVVTAAAIALALLASLPPKEPFRLPPYPGPAISAPAAPQPKEVPTVTPEAPPDDTPETPPEVTPEVTPEVPPEEPPTVYTEIIPYTPYTPDTPITPEVSPDPHSDDITSPEFDSISLEVGGDYMVYVYYNITLNSLEGGSATATLQRKAGGSYGQASPDSTTTYSGGSGSSWDSSFEYQADEVGSAIEWFRVVVDYTMSSGQAGQLISNEVPAFLGYYIADVYTYHSSNSIIVKVTLDPSLVDTSVTSSAPVIYKDGTPVSSGDYTVNASEPYYDSGYISMDFEFTPSTAGSSWESGEYEVEIPLSYSLSAGGGTYTWPDTAYDSIEI